MRAERAGALGGRPIEVDAVPARSWFGDVGLEVHAVHCGHGVAREVSLWSVRVQSVPPATHVCRDRS